MDKKLKSKDWKKSGRIGWLINERLINMPPQIAPALFRLLVEELQNAQAQYDYILYVTKTYREVDSELDKELQQAQQEAETSARLRKKRKRPKMTSMSSEAFYFQAEDEVVAKHALMKWDFKPKETKESRVADAMRVFSDCGFVPERRVFLLDGKVLPQLQIEMAAFIGQ